MLLRHTLSLTLSNMKLVFKVLLYALVIIVLGSAVIVTIATPILDALGETINLKETVDHFIDNVLSGEGSALDGVIGAFEHFSEIHSGDLVKGAVLFLLVVFIAKLMLALVVCPVAYVLNGKMATNFTEGFFHSVMVVGWKGVLLATVYTLISFPIDFGIILGSFYLGKWMLQGIGIFGIVFALGVLLVLFSLRMSLMGQLVPTLISENIKFDVQFKRGLRQGFKLLKKTFPSMLALNIFAFGIITTTLIPTVFIIPIVTVPMVLVGYVSIHLITYYRENNREYYIDEHVIKTN